MRLLVLFHLDSTFRVRFSLETCTKKGSRSRSRDGTPSSRLSTSRCALTCMLFLFFTCLKIFDASRSCLVHLNWTRHLRDAPKILTQILCFRMPSMDSNLKGERHSCSRSLVCLAEEALMLALWSARCSTGFM